MIVNERITDYIHSLGKSQGPLLDSIEAEARENLVPIIRRETAALLRTMTAALGPSRILEIGTAVGYSALLMCQVMPKDCHITTMEKFEKRIPIARENFKRAGETERITPFGRGYAGALLKELKGNTFQLIFMDAAKGQYIHWLPDVVRLLAPGGVLMSDNVLQEGELIESHYLVERRNRTIYKRMREYLYELKHHPQLMTSIIPLGDGVSLSVKEEA